MIVEEQIRGLLASWYSIHQRVLPWRGIKDPYRIWLSEVILQQTRVIQGYDYYLHFVEHFPTIKDLALSTEEEVLHLWKGLGYYTRARNLHKAARRILDLYGGVFPHQYEEILSLEGVGKYTAVAIASFAFNLPYATIDGNVQRVLSRLYCIMEPVNTPSGEEILQTQAELLLDRKHPAIHNQAVMELGALVCTPKTPHCTECPLKEHCLSYANGNVELLPIKQKKIVMKERFFSYLRIVCKGETLLLQRTKRDIWKNLYEYPMVETSQPVPIDTLMKNELLQEFLPFKHSPLKEITKDFIHQLTHQKLHISLFELSVKEFPPLSTIYKVVERGEESSFPISRLMEILMGK
ncbi:MAG TPA: A/G-specific adenine glycosylase [Porphyromonadaceae bacterium]|nr:A/G-specific adenine glycosylase [Porphyromonadaceae bacterium]